MQFKGLNHDIRKEVRPEGYSEGNLNIVIDNIGSVTNEPGFRQATSSVVGDLCGYITTTDKVVLIYKRDDGLNEIGLFDGLTYVPKVRGNMGFSPEYPIQGTFKRNNQDELIVALTDDHNPPYLINLDNLPFSLNANLEPSSADKLELLYMFQSFNQPLLRTKLNLSGGALLTGTYFFAVAYEYSDGGLSNISSITSGIPVTPNVSVNDFNGGSVAQITSRSVEVTISDYDTSYTKAVLYIIKKVDGQLITERIDQEIVLDGATVTYTYTGGEQTTTTTISEVLVDSASYTRIGVMENYDDRLYIGDLTVDETINLQPYINNVRINYTMETIDPRDPNNSYYDGEFTNKKRGFCFGEVYAMYMSVKLKKGGQWTRAFHIPGRPATNISYINNNGTRQIVSAQEESKVGLLRLSASLPDADDLNDDYQISTDARYFHFRETADNPAASTNMGYWENEDERYPENSNFDGSITGPDIAGEKVRHHKFPSLNYIRRKLNDDTIFTQSHPILGISVSNVNFGPFDDLIDGYKIFFAKRTVENSTVLGTSGVITSFERDDNDPPGIRPSGLGNYDGVQGAIPNSELRKEYFRTNAPDLLLNKPQVAPQVIMQEYVINASESVRGTIQSRISEYQYFNGVSRAVDNANYVIPSSLEQYTYFPVNVNGLKYNNIGGEEAMIFHAHNSEDKWEYATPEYILLGSGTNTEEMSVVTIRQFLPNVYLGFNNRPTLIATNEYFKVGTAGQTFGGDMVISNYHQLNTSVTFYEDALEAGNTYDGGNKQLRIYPVQTINNFNLRGENTSPQSKLLGNGLDNYRILQPLEIVYNADYSQLNEFNQVFTEQDENFQTSFPYRIARSPATTETDDSSWRTFPVNDYYNGPRNRGKMMRLVSFLDRLLIHYRYGMFITVGSDTFVAENNNYDIGTGDIFRSKPNEITPDKGGYYGIKSYFSSLVCNYGYIFIDDRGNLMLYNGDKQELSAKSMNNYFRDQYPKARTNPFIDNCAILTYDDYHNRLLVSLFDTTLSFDFKLQNWFSFHSYRPQVYMNINDNTYSVFQGKIYEHNTGPRGKYYNEQVFDSSVDTILRTDTKSQLNVLVVNCDTDESEPVGKPHNAIIYNGHQCSGLIPFAAERVSDMWRFNKFMDVATTPPFFNPYEGLTPGEFDPGSVDDSKPWYQKARFKGKFVIVKLIIDNTHNEIHYIHSIQGEFKPVIR